MLDVNNNTCCIRENQSKQTGQEKKNWNGNYGCWEPVSPDSQVTLGKSLYLIESEFQSWKRNQWSVIPIYTCTRILSSTFSTSSRSVLAQRPLMRWNPALPQAILDTFFFTANCQEVFPDSYLFTLLLLLLSDAK